MTTLDTPKRKRRMSVAVAHKYKMRLRRQLESLGRRVITEQLSFTWMLEIYHEGICAGDDWKRAPGHIHAFARGWFDCFCHFTMYMSHVDWRVWEEGRGHVRTRTHGGVDTVDYSKVHAEKGAHCWSTTGKVWHGYDPTGEAYRKPGEDVLAFWRGGFA